LAAKRKVEAEEAETYAKENGLFFMETSTKTAQNVNELFYEITHRLPKERSVKQLQCSGSISECVMKVSVICLPMSPRQTYSF